ncbi:UNKNOWN [Stylonychia lemnae]|uniref:Uncharacterized protein n=1 Tax=Stylonychia lemnae TaxID=5949 RepID=A0A078ANE4_STYLE|nr:UNKNOWN [Stylonychia lemnae]|eukprot:CDW83694.1 UNKNOWN [Stylonychia lemnae]
MGFQTVKKDDREFNSNPGSLNNSFEIVVDQHLNKNQQPNQLQKVVLCMHYYPLIIPLEPMNQIKRSHDSLRNEKNPRNQNSNNQNRSSQIFNQSRKSNQSNGTGTAADNQAEMSFGHEESLNNQIQNDPYSDILSMQSNKIQSQGQAKSSRKTSYQFAINNSNQRKTSRSGRVSPQKSLESYRSNTSQQSKQQQQQKSSVHEKLRNLHVKVNSQGHNSPDKDSFKNYLKENTDSSRFNKDDINSNNQNFSLAAQQEQKVYSFSSRTKQQQQSSNKKSSHTKEIPIYKEISVNEDFLTFIQEENVDHLEYKRNPQSSNVKSVFIKLYNDRKIYEQKKRDLSAQKIDPDASECTFQPNAIQSSLNGRPKSTTRRNNEEFLQDMQRYQELKDKKLDQLKRAYQDKELEECRKSVSRSRSRLDISVSRNGQDQPIHERLHQQDIHNVKYSHRRLSNDMSHNENQNPEEITTYRSKNEQKLSSSEITKKLYEDAIKRKEQERSKSGQRTARDHEKYKTSERSNEVYAGRILKQIEKAFSDLECLQVISIDFDKFVDILKYLGYANNEMSLKEKILTDAWAQIGGSENRNISKRSLIIFINCLNNIYLQWMSNIEDRSEDYNGMDIDIAEFYVRSLSEMQYIHNKFFAFWENRSKIKNSSIIGGNISLSNLNKSLERDLNQSENSTFRPFINEKSQQIALNHLTQLQQELEKLNIPFNHQDYLIKKGIIQKQKLRDLENKLICEEISQCSFKPKTNNTVRQRDRSVFDELYGDPEQLREKIVKNIPRDPAEIEFEKQKDQCTFMPKLIKSNSKTLLISKAPTMTSGISNIIQSNNASTKVQSGIQSSKNMTPRMLSKVSSQLGSGNGLQGKSSYSIKQKSSIHSNQKSQISIQLKDNNPFRKENQAKSRENRQRQTNKNTNECLNTNKNLYNQRESDQFYEFDYKIQDYTKKLPQNQQNSNFKTSVKQKQNSNLNEGFETLEQSQQNKQDMLSQQNSSQVLDNFTEKMPLLFLDVNLGKGEVSRLVFYNGDDPEYVAESFVRENKLDQGKKIKLLGAINQQLEMIKQRYLSELNVRD